MHFLCWLNTLMLVTFFNQLCNLSDLVCKYKRCILIINVMYE